MTRPNSKRTLRKVGLARADSCHALTECDRQEPPDACCDAGIKGQTGDKGDGGNRGSTGPQGPPGTPGGNNPSPVSGSIPVLYTSPDDTPLQPPGDVAYRITGGGIGLPSVVNLVIPGVGFANTSRLLYGWYKGTLAYAAFDGLSPNTAGNPAPNWRRYHFSAFVYEATSVMTPGSQNKLVRGLLELYQKTPGADWEFIVSSAPGSALFTGLGWVAGPSAVPAIYGFPEIHISYLRI